MGVRKLTKFESKKTTFVNLQIKGET